MGCLVCHCAHGKCGTRPAVHQGPTWWNSPSCWSPSNLMITITCSPRAALHSRWFVSNWPVPFAWLIWLLHFSLSPLWWLLWHYRCWVSLITSLIGLEMLHASLFWGKVVVCCELHNIPACFIHLKRQMNPSFLADCGEDAGGNQTEGQQAAGTVGRKMERSGN